MSIILRDYQKEAMDRILDTYNGEGNSIASVCISTGFGAGVLLCECIKSLLAENANMRVLYLVSRREEVFQVTKAISETIRGVSICNSLNEYSNQSVIIITYAAYFAKKRDIECDMIICRDAEALNSEKYRQLICGKSKLTLGVYNWRNENQNNIFRDAPCLLEIRSLFNCEFSFQSKIVVPMLEYTGYTDIQADNKLFIDDAVVCPDIVAFKDGVKYFIEVKTYRGIYNDRQVVRYAVNSLNRNKSILQRAFPGSRFMVILTCDVDENTKAEIAKDYGIIVWDIKNLLYLCGGNIGLLNELEQITSYSLTGIRPVQPIEINFSAKQEAPSAFEINYELQLIERLNNCKTGRTDKADKEYEKICAEIISYLFKNEFSQFSEQYSTKDDMFRMDIICGLKGTVAFWKFLINYYNTKFVVFECKNYSHKIEQNLIYVTDKYLFNPVLRNVAFIISRKGFSANAQKAALGILKEQGKLILDLNDLDLEIMIKAKADGKEPSDYLLDKVEKLLMSVSI